MAEADLCLLEIATLTIRHNFGDDLQKVHRFPFGTDTDDCDVHCSITSLVVLADSCVA